MASTRSIISPPPFAEDASTVIPPTPIAGVSYRDPAAGPASSPDGWPYGERVNSAEWNQLVYQWSSMLSIMDKKGVLGWTDLVDYTEASIVFGSDGVLYKWLQASGPNNGGAKDPASNPVFWGSLSALLSTAVSGGGLNVSMNLFAPSASAVMTADQVVVASAMNGQTYRLSNVSEAINLSTTGAGGMDTGASPVNGYVALYLIYNPSTGEVSLLGKNATAGVQTEIYSGANMPAGYTASALMAVVPTNVSGQMKVLRVQGRTVWIVLATAFTSTANVPLQTVSISGVVPPNAKEVFGELGIASGAAANLSLSIISDIAAGVGQQILSSSLGAGSNSFSNYANMALGGTQAFAVAASTTGASPTFNVYIGGYKI